MSFKNDNRVVYTVGNTYQRIPNHRARYDRSGRNLKTHDWALYLDILQGNPDLIQRVTFDLGPSFQPRSFACSCPIQVKRPDGKQVWRFSTRQQSYGSVKAKISILGAGGTKSEAEHSIQLSVNAYLESAPVKVFVERSRPKTLPMLKISPDQNFGVELELTLPASEQLEQVASRLTQKLRGRFGRIVVFRDYAEGRHTNNVWKMVPDSSVVCSVNNPNCNTFELVSPILQGGNGLNQAGQVLDALGKLGTNLQVNKSMGFHVHVDVSGLGLSQLIKICQNCIKYEDVIDALVPPSRRTGSQECDAYFRSNRLAMEQHFGYRTNKQRHDALEACRSMQELAQMMNPRNSRYHKVNMQNLVRGRQSTIEFRQHSATSNSRKVSSWVRFCVTLVTNSARLASPRPFKEGRDLDYQFDALFQFVVKDRALRDYYNGRKLDLDVEEHESCCQECAAGNGACASRRLKHKGSRLF